MKQALATVKNDWAKILDNKGQVDTFILDFEKAFDTPQHELLKSKLFSYGIGGKTLKWRNAFLCYRQQRVVVKPVSHQPCCIHAPVRVDNFLDFVRQSHGVVYYTARLSYAKQGRKAAATNVRHVHFLCDLLAFSERCTTAARHTRLTQDYCKTRKVFVRLTL